MSAVTLPMTQPTGRALIVGQPACRPMPVSALVRMGLTCTEMDEPYDAMVHLCRRPLFYSTLILSLNSLYREELQIIASIKRRYSHIEVWLSDTDGRHAALAEAMRLGADGLVDAQGLHRIGGGPVPQAPNLSPSPQMLASAEDAEFDKLLNMKPAARAEIAGRSEPGIRIETTAPAASQSADPLLTAEELRALLQENPVPSPD
ncbi:MAG: hypothetical protein M3O30_00840 [Planctomycetota bacterium]|nr:hypothetical protein [Planctomycetota bacterium]